MALLTQDQRYLDYLKIVANPDRMVTLTKIEFLNPDDSVAYVLDGNYKRG